MQTCLRCVHSCRTCPFRRADACPRPVRLAPCASQSISTLEEVSRMRLPSIRSLVRFSLLTLLCAGLAFLLAPGAQASAAAEQQAAGHVYVLNNNLSGSNSITVFNRA